jgi:hypothetical protein
MVDLYAERYLALVSDLATWDSYRLWLDELLYPQAWVLLFGDSQAVITLTSAPMLELDRQIAARCRYWMRRSSEVLGEKTGAISTTEEEAAEQIDASGAPVESPAGSPAAKNYSTPLGRNVDTFRKQCGWSYDVLAREAGVGKKSSLSHVNAGKGANEETLRRYADAFSRALGREITIQDLLR